MVDTGPDIFSELQAEINKSLIKSHIVSITKRAYLKTSDRVMFSKLNPFSSPFSKFSLQATFTKYDKVLLLPLHCYQHFGIVCQNKKVEKMMLGPGSHQCRESSLQGLSIAPEMKETWKSNPQPKIFEWETLRHASSFDISIHLNIIRSILKEGRRVNGDRWWDLADAGRWDLRHPWYLDGVNKLLLVWTYISVCITVML